ncbi:hypothetical protein EON71_00555 [bacterium]|nr:MAG: hypothetical protein EON71_00555 [bacterium]
MDEPSTQTFETDHENDIEENQENDNLLLEISTIANKLAWYQLITMYIITDYLKRDTINEVTNVIVALHTMYIMMCTYEYKKLNITDSKYAYVDIFFKKMIIVDFMSNVLRVNNLNELKYSERGVLSDEKIQDISIYIKKMIDATRNIDRINEIYEFKSLREITDFVTQTQSKMEESSTMRTLLRLSVYSVDNGGGGITIEDTISELFRIIINTGPKITFEVNGEKDTTSIKTQDLHHTEKSYTVGQIIYLSYLLNMTEYADLREIKTKSDIANYMEELTLDLKAQFDGDSSELSNCLLKTYIEDMVSAFSSPDFFEIVDFINSLQIGVNCDFLIYRLKMLYKKTTNVNVPNYEDLNIFDAVTSDGLTWYLHDNDIGGNANDTETTDSAGKNLNVFTSFNHDLSKKMENTLTDKHNDSMSLSNIEQHSDDDSMQDDNISDKIPANAISINTILKQRMNQNVADKNTNQSEETQVIRNICINKATSDSSNSQSLIETNCALENNDNPISGGNEVMGDTSDNSQINIDPTIRQPDTIKRKNNTDSTKTTKKRRTESNPVEELASLINSIVIRDCSAINFLLGSSDRAAKLYYSPL